MNSPLIQITLKCVHKCAIDDITILAQVMDKAIILNSDNQVHCRIYASSGLNKSQGVYIAKFQTLKTKVGCCMLTP